MIVKLVVVHGSTTVNEVTLRRPRTVAGRKKGCKLRIRSELVSRIHCSFLRTADRLTVKDLGSSNGTFVNGVRVNEAVLKAGDAVQIGPIKFVVKILDDAPATVVESDTPAGYSQPDENAVFVESDDEPESIQEADLLAEMDDEIEFITDEQAGSKPVPPEESIFFDDDQPIEADRFTLPDEDDDGYRLANGSKREP